MEKRIVDPLTDQLPTDGSPSAIIFDSGDQSGVKQFSFEEMGAQALDEDASIPNDNEQEFENSSKGESGPAFASQTVAKSASKFILTFCALLIPAIAFKYAKIDEATIMAEESGGQMPLGASQFAKDLNTQIKQAADWKEEYSDLLREPLTDMLLESDIQINASSRFFIGFGSVAFLMYQNISDAKEKALKAIDMLREEYKLSNNKEEASQSKETIEPIVEIVAPITVNENVASKG